MFAQSVVSFSFRIALLFLAAQGARAQEVELGRQLAEEMAFAQAFDDAQAVCIDMAERHDVEQNVSEVPGLLGGVQPGDADWTEAKALYIDMLKAGCRYDKAVAEEAFAKALGQSMSASDMHALIAFYRSELGGRFLRASLAANIAANRAAQPTVDSKAAYATFEEQLGAFLARRKAPDESVGAVEGADSADSAVAISDRIMQHVTAGQVREALALGKPYSIVPDAEIEALVKQLEQQRPILAARFGGSVNYELLRNDTVGDSLLRTVFLHRFEKHAMVWQFIWYRGNDGWVLTNFRFADDVSLLFR